MLRSCESFDTSYGLKFNPSKTQFIKFSACASQIAVSPTVMFCGSPLPLSNSVVHLGNILTSDLSDSQDIEHKCHDMLTKVNTLLSRFSSETSF